MFKSTNHTWDNAELIAGLNTIIKMNDLTSHYGIKEADDADRTDNHIP